MNTSIKIFVPLLFITLLLATVQAQAQEIFDAVQKGDLAKVKVLVKINPPLVNSKNELNRTPLHVAAMEDQDEIARYLIDHGADINAQDGYNFTPLMFAGIKVARVLVEKGVDINFLSPNGNSSGLGVAILFGKKDVAEYLLELGAKIPEAGTPNSFIYLQNALKIGSSKYLEKYLSQGNSPLIEDEFQNTLFHYAAEGNSVELFEKLISLGVQKNKFNIRGWTPLHIAVYNGNLAVVELLLKKGVDKNERTLNGKTAYNLAHELKNTDIINYLISVGADKSGPVFPILEGEYLGQSKPGNKPVPFAPGIVAVNGLFHGSITFSPDGNEAYWSIQEENRLFTSRRANGKWTMPATVKSIADGDVPFISPDGKKFYFTGGKTIHGKKKEIIYVRDKSLAGWSEPHPLPEIINSLPGIHWQMSVDRIGNLYFGATQNGTSSSRIYCSRYKNGKYSNPQIIEELKDVDAFSPFIAPDGNYLMICKGESISILFKKKDGTWTQSQDITSIIGKAGICPMVTPDGKYLFFIADIPYWIDTSFIEELRKKELNENFKGTK